MSAAQAVPAATQPRGHDVVGDTIAIAASFQKTWLDRAGARVEASPGDHIEAMLHNALRSRVLRPVDGKVSDGFHTFDELYRHRMLLTALLFGLLAHGPDWPKYDVHRSLLHHDGEEPFGGGWFIVMATLPTGQVSYHYPLEHWELFDGIPDVLRAGVWDGHSSEEAADRMQRFLEDGGPWA